MSESERRETIEWIERLQSKEGRESFKRTMEVGDYEVDQEIALAKRLLKEDEEWNQRIKSGFQIMT